MDILTFLAKLIESIAWPVAMIVGIILLRTSIIALIPGLKKLRYKDLELDFEKKIEQLEVKAEQANLPEPRGSVEVPPLKIPPENFLEYIEQLARVSPVAAISEAWRVLEIVMTIIVKRDFNKENIRTRETIRTLKEKGAISDEVMILLEDLRGLRNEVVHALDPEISYEQAIEYGKLAQRVRVALGS